jgi:hypothetical protein
MTSVWGALAFIAMLSSFAVYIRAVLKSRNDPNPKQPARVTWFLWMCTDWLALSGMYVAGTVNAQICAATLGATTVFLLSIRYGTTTGSVLDFICLALGVCGIVAWIYAADPLAAIIASQFINAVGSVPSGVNAWHGKESRLAWSLGGVSCVAGVFAITQWTPAGVIQPITFIAINVIIVTIVWTRPQHAEENPEAFVAAP